MKLIKEYESLENLYEHLHEVKGAKLVENLKKNRELAFTSRSLATIVRDVDLDYELDDFRVKEMDRNEITELYRRLEFNSLLAALTKDDKPHAQSTEKIPDLFLINSPDAARAFLASINPGQKISLHIHTDYHHPMWCQLLGIYLAIDDKVHLLEMGPDKQDRLYWIKELLENPLVPKYLHNAKFAEVLLLRFGVKLEGVAGDTLLAAYVDDPAFEGEAVSSAFLKYMNLAVSEIIMMSSPPGCWIYTKISQPGSDLSRQVCSQRWKCPCHGSWRLWNSRALKSNRLLWQSSAGNWRPALYATRTAFMNWPGLILILIHPGSWARFFSKN